MSNQNFSDDFWKQFRTPQEKDQDEHCQNCGVQLFDDDDPTSYERGYCRGCQITKRTSDEDLELEEVTKRANQRAKDLMEIMDVRGFAQMLKGQS